MLEHATERPNEMPDEIKAMLQAMPLSIETLDLDKYWEGVCKFLEEEEESIHTLMFNPDIQPLVFPLRHPKDLAKSCENLAEFLGSELCIKMVNALPKTKNEKQIRTKRSGLIHYISATTRAGYPARKIIEIARKIYESEPFPIDQELNGLNLALRGMSTRYADMDADKGYFGEIQEYAEELGPDKAQHMYRAAILSTRQSPIAMYMYALSLQKGVNLEGIQDLECIAASMTDAELLTEATLTNGTKHQVHFINEFTRRHPEEIAELMSWLKNWRNSKAFQKKYFGTEKKINKKTIAYRTAQKERILKGEIHAAGTPYLRAEKIHKRNKRNAEVERIWEEKTDLYQVPIASRFKEGIMAIKLSRDEDFQKRIAKELIQGCKGQTPWLAISNLIVHPELFDLFAKEILKDPETTAEMCDHWKDSTNFIHNGASLLCISTICKTYPEEFERIVRRMLKNVNSLKEERNKDSFVFFLHQFSSDEQKQILSIFLGENIKKEKKRTAKQLKNECVFLARVNTDTLQIACDEYFTNETETEHKEVQFQTMHEFSELDLPTNFDPLQALKDIEHKKSLLATGERRIQIKGFNITIVPSFKPESPVEWKTSVEKDGEKFHFEVKNRGNNKLDIRVGGNIKKNEINKTNIVPLLEKLKKQIVYLAHLLYVREEAIEEGFVKDVKTREASTQIQTGLTKGITKRARKATLTTREKEAIDSHKKQLREVMANSRDQIGKLLAGEAVEAEKLFVFKLFNPEDPSEGYTRVEADEVEKRREEGTLTENSSENPQLYILSTEPHVRRIGVYKKSYPFAETTIVIPYKGSRTKEAEKKHLRHERSGLPIMGKEAFQSIIGTTAEVIESTTLAVRDEDGNVIGIRNPDEATQLANTLKNDENYSKAWSLSQLAQLKTDIKDRLEAGWPNKNIELREMMAEAIAWEINSTSIPVSINQLYQLAQAKVSESNSDTTKDKYDILRLSVLHELLFNGVEHPAVEAFKHAKQRTHIEFREGQSTLLEMGVEVPFNIDFTYVEGVFTPLSEVKLEEDTN